MERVEVLEKLASGEPLFQRIPPIRFKLITGLETEYGVEQDQDGQPKDDFDNLEGITDNGGLVYRDLAKLEYATPECTNALDVTRFYAAGDRICAPYSQVLYRHNNDWRGNTFASHESYFTKLSKDERHQLLPWFVVRQIITGAGWQSLDSQGKDGEYFLSQRALFMKEVESEYTLEKRGILNTRKEPLAKVDGYDRFHVINGDANMSEVSLFLRVGLTQLFIHMAENGELPRIQYDENNAIDDMKEIAKCREGWYLRGRTEKIGAVELVRKYLHAAKKDYSGIDDVLDAVQIIAEDTLDKLQENSVELTRRLDWKIKLGALELFAQEKDSVKNPMFLCAQDLEYHKVHDVLTSDKEPDFEMKRLGTYQLLAKQKMVERIVSDALKEDAIYNPPQDTRAYIRGSIKKRIGEASLKKKLVLVPHPTLWGALVVISKKEYHRYKFGGKELNEIIETAEPKWTKEISNPFNPSLEIEQEFSKWLSIQNKPFWR